MSMHWMDKLWSWDHCFNALALAHGETDAAVDQFLAPFDHQDATGALPDSITHSEVLYNYVKPPIHGWALRGLRDRADRRARPPPSSTEIHGRLVSWTTFWLDHRRVPGNPLPYYQHGNDSGWDNATTFDVDRVIESPDLAGFLALQLEVLADLSDELGLPADRWRSACETCSTRCCATCGPGRSSSPSAHCRGGRAPPPACSTCCRSCWGSGCPPTCGTRSPRASRVT